MCYRRLLCAGLLSGAVFGPYSVAVAAGSALLKPPADPFSTADQLHTEAPSGQSCVLMSDVPLSLVQVVDRALCANPQTREAWANARYQAAQLGVAQAAWLPNVSATLASNRVHADGGVGIQGTYNQSSLALSASWLLYDFGARDASVEAARQLLLAANASQDATLHTVFLAAVQAWSQWFAAQGAVAAARESEKASQESLRASERRYEVGTATPADRLQARTAWSQAVLARIKAEGDERTARGVLMNVLGLPADAMLPVAQPEEIQPVASFEADLKQLIQSALAARPDLAAAEAQVKVAQAGVAQAKAAGLPSLSLTSSVTDGHSSAGNPSRNDTIGLSLSVPIFTGYAQTYRIRSAEEQLALKEATRERIANQVSLDVWKTYHALITATESVRAASDLLASAGQSRRVAKGRYDAGVGGILDLLSAESALANARQQEVQARFSWLSARFALAQALGRLSLADLVQPERSFGTDKK